MRVFDLHCDTASYLYHNQAQLYQHEGQLDLKRGESFDQWVQTFAFFLDDAITGELAWQEFEAQYRYFTQQLQQYELQLYQAEPQRRSALLMMEGAGMLGGRLDRIELLAERQIELLTITWNGQNQWASGAQAQGGLTLFGKQGISLLEQHGILVDVSHVNQESFWDIEHYSKEPLVATHSNAKSVWDHPRNLTDDQIKAIVSRGGIIGINFYPLFVNGKEDCAFEELAKHIERFCALGADKQLCLGSDFDGAPMPTALFSVKQLENYHAFMVKWFGKNFTEDLFFENANRFFTAHRQMKGRKTDVISKY